MVAEAYNALRQQMRLDSFEPVEQVALHKSLYWKFVEAVRQPLCAKGGYQAYE